MVDQLREPGFDLVVHFSPELVKSDFLGPVKILLALLFLSED